MEEQKDFDSEFSNYEQKEKARKFVAEYLEKIDKKLTGMMMGKRLINQYDNLLDYIKIAFLTYYTTNSIEACNNFNVLVLSLLEILLYQVVISNELPSSEMMDSIINELGNKFNYDSNKNLSEKLVQLLIKVENEECSHILELINEKLGDIIYNQKNLFTKYYLMILDLNDIFLKKDNKFEDTILKFIGINNDEFKIPSNSLINRKTLSEFLANDYKIEKDSNNEKSYTSKENQSQETQETEGKEISKSDEITNIKDKNKIDEDIEKDSKEDKLAKLEKNFMEVYSQFFT